MNIFEKCPIDTSTVQKDLQFLSLQLEVAKELSNCPNFLKYIQLQGQETLRDSLKVDFTDTDKALILQSNLQGQFEAYEHLNYLVENANVIQQEYLSKSQEIEPQVEGN